MKKSFRNFPGCHSGSRLDEFVARLFEFKKHGTYVDVGAADSKFHNNSHYMDTQLDWRGICIEMDPKWNDTYGDRKRCTYINADATKLDYRQIFIDKGLPEAIDYLSMDVDDADLTVLKMLPLNDFDFKIIGIEHDCYAHGPIYRDAQRAHLLEAEYVLVCADVYVRNPNFENCSFEDWWVNPYYFSREMINKLIIKECYSEDIIDLFLNGKTCHYCATFDINMDARLREWQCHTCGEKHSFV